MNATIDRPTDLIPTTAAAKICGKTAVSTIHRWILKGRLAGWRLGGRVFVREADVRALWELIAPPLSPEPSPVPTKRETRQADAWADAVLRAKGVRR